MNMYASFALAGFDSKYNVYAENAFIHYSDAIRRAQDDKMRWGAVGEGIVTGLKNTFNSDKIYNYFMNPNASLSDVVEYQSGFATTISITKPLYEMGTGFIGRLSSGGATQSVALAGINGKVYTQASAGLLSVSGAENAIANSSISFAASAFGGSQGEGTSSTVFENGEMFESKIITKNGIEIGGLADVEINGKTLTLKDVAVYSNKGDIPNAVGARDIFKWQNEIAQQAKAQGFDTLIIKGVRAMNSTSANPGKVVEYIIDLTKLK